MDSSPFIPAKRRNKNPFTRSRDTDSDSDRHHSPPPSGNGKDEAHKESYLAITVVILLFVVAIIAVGYSYHMERSFRFELENENNMNIEVIKACDRMQLRHQEKMRANAISMDTLHNNNAPCTPCVDCEAEAVKEQKRVDELETFELARVTAEIADYEGLKKQLENERYKKLTKGLQSVARELLYLEYGEPPYFVELELELPSTGSTPGLRSKSKSVTTANSKAENGKRSVIQLEMAPIDEMPYSVLYFMTHVQNGAFDGCNIGVNAGHILAADLRGPSCNMDLFDIGSSSESLASAPTFITTKLAFQEYSTKFPHKANTVAFSGRFVSKMFARYMHSLYEYAMISPTVLCNM